MRYEGKRPSGQDKEVDVYNFVMGIQEVRAMSIALKEMTHRMPKCTETQVLRARLRNMSLVIEKFATSEQKNLK